MIHYRQPVLLAAARRVCEYNVPCQVSRGHDKWAWCGAKYSLIKILILLTVGSPGTRCVIGERIDARRTQAVAKGAPREK